jgi:uncharacterized protein (DUF2147 family)
MAQTKPDDIVGLWFTEDKDAKIKIYPQDGKYFGKIVWHKTGPEISPYDENNPDEELRKQKKIGLVMLRDFEYDDGEWEDGKIYDPKSGKTYSCVMKLNDDGSLYVRGYIGVSFIGRTTNWTRAD